MRLARELSVTVRGARPGVAGRVIVVVFFARTRRTGFTVLPAGRAIFFFRCAFMRTGVS
jgi:hypothetical protein